MADDAQRGVNFTLKATVDPAAKQIVDQWFTSISSSLDGLSNSITAATAATTQGVSSAVGSSQQAVSASTATQSTQIQQFFEQTNQAAQAYLDSQAQRAAETAQREQQIRDVSQMSYEQLLEEQTAIRRSAIERDRQILAEAIRQEENSVREYFEAVEKLREKSLDNADSITDQEISLVQSLEQAAVRAVENRQRADAKYNQTAARQRAESVNEALRGIERERAARERAAAEAVQQNERIAAATSRVISALANGTESVIRLAKGFAQLGLIGETDLKKLTDSLLWIQGSSEVFTGLVRSIRQVAEGYNAYRQTIILTTEATHALNAATATGAAIRGGASGVAARGVAGLAGGAVGVAGGAIGAGVAGGVVGGAGAPAAVPIMAQLAISSAAAGNTLGAAAAPTGLVAAGLSALIGIPIAITAMIAEIGMLAQIIQQARKYGPGEGADPDTLVNRIGSSRYNPFFQQMLMEDEETNRHYTAAIEGEKRLEQAQKQRQLNLQRQAVDEQELAKMQAVQASVMARQSQLAREITDSRLQAMKPEERREELIRTIANTEANSSLGVEDRARRVIQLSKERLQAEQEIYRTQIQAAADAQREDQRKVDDLTRRIDAEKSALLSAQERFGMMDDAAQQSIIDIAKQFQGGGAGQLDVQELQKLRGFSGAIDEQIAAEARRRAVAAGFGVVQAADAQKITAMEQQRVQIEANVRAQAQVIAKLELDAKAVADQINQQIDTQLKVIMNRMVEEILQNSIGIKKLEDVMIKRFGGV